MRQAMWNMQEACTAHEWETPGADKSGKNNRGMYLYWANAGNLLLIIDKLG